MRFWLRLTVTGFVLAGVAVTAWAYANRDAMARQWMCYRVGSAKSYEEARDALRWFEQGPEYQFRLQELMGKWGTGNQQFDLYLAQYTGSPESSEVLRERFSLEFGWRDELIGRWAHYWAWRARQEPDVQVASILEYFDMLASVDPPKPITWREVLDLQAVFQITGHAELAQRLKPANWQHRYVQWNGQRPTRLPDIARPQTPFPDWQGPAPD